MAACFKQGLFKVAESPWRQGAMDSSFADNLHSTPQHPYMVSMLACVIHALTLSATATRGQRLPSLLPAWKTPHAKPKYIYSSPIAISHLPCATVLSPIMLASAVVQIALRSLLGAFADGGGKICEGFAALELGILDHSC